MSSYFVMVKSNLRWPGGKSKMLKTLDGYIPARVDKYLEVFTGGGSVLLHVLQTRRPRTVYANDIDRNLINYYTEVRERPSDLMAEISAVKSAHTPETFAGVFRGMDMSRASGFYIVNKTSFSGLPSGYSKLAYERNFTEKTTESIGEISKVIRDVVFLNSDFGDLDSVIGDISGYFIYLDPPYYYNMKTGLYGRRGDLHKGFDHERLCGWVKSHAGRNRIMMSYDDSERIRELYSDFRIFGFESSYNMTNTGGNACKTGREIIITNYRKPNTLF